MTPAERKCKALSDAEAKRVIKAAVSESGASVNEVTGPQRKRELVRLRWKIMAALYRRGYSQPRIGRLLNRDHSTVHYGLAKAGLIGLPR